MRGGVPIERLRGFTLLEVLVALALMGLLSVGLVASFRLAQRAQDQAFAAQARLGELRALRGFLVRTLEGAYPFERGATMGLPVAPLQGGPDQLDYTGPSGGGEWGTGWARYALSLSPRRDGLSDLRVAWAVDRNGTVLPAESKAGPSEVLLSKIVSLQWSYLAKEAAGEGTWAWRTNWHDRTDLPAVIRLRVSLAPAGRASTEEWWFMPRLTEDAQCAFDPVSERCRGAGA